MVSYDYEESRKKRVEENKKRMEQLNLHALSRSLVINKIHSPAKKVRSRSADLGVTPRRSVRTADKPAPNYKEKALEPLGRRYSSKKRLPRDNSNASAEERAYATQQAQDLESTLGSKFPTCVKPMLHSHVSGGFWLSLPLPFCRDNLPTPKEAKEVTVTLVDEDDYQWDTNYLTYKNGLSGGWRTFSIDHDLRDGDTLVFQLIRPKTFKVYIVRVGSTEQLQDMDHADAAKTAKSRARKGTKRK